MVSPHPGSLREPALPVRGLLVTGAVPLACGLARAHTPGQTHPGGGERRAAIDTGAPRGQPHRRVDALGREPRFEPGVPLVWYMATLKP
jgi:hypothetical protein